MKNEKAITLVALIITIIVLLILATVGINLSMNDGIITKSKNIADKYSEEEILHKIKMAYLEYENERLFRTNLDAEEYITSDLEDKFGEGTITNVSIKNKKLKLTIGEKIYQYDISTGKVGEYVYIDPFNYGTKTKATIVAGNDITIGTERFMVFFKGTETDETSTYYNKQVIKAMPYYNLVTVTADETVKQGPAIPGTSTEIESKFSTIEYWTLGEDAIDMTNPNNLIQQNITAYKTTLERLGAEEIIVRAVRYSELTAKGVTITMRNPGNSGKYWIGSGSTDYNRDVYYLYNRNNFSTGVCYNISLGVRPIIIIPVD